MIVKPIKTDIAGMEVIEGYRLVTSYSQIDKYLQCPYSWYLKYVEKIESNIKAKALEYGLAVHETLEYFFDMRKLGIDLLEPEVKNYYKTSFNKREIPFDSFEEEMDYLEQGVIAVDRLYSPVNEVEKLMVDPTTEILGVEESFEVVIKLPKKIEVAFVDHEGQQKILKTDEVTIVGFIDLVLRTPDGIVIIDHKSGKTLFDKKKLEENLQFPIYCMAILEKYGELPVKNLYNFTKLHKCQEVVVDESRIEKSKEDCISVFKKMNRAKHTAKPSFLCFWCDFSMHKLNVCNKSSDFKPKSAR